MPQDQPRREDEQEHVPAQVEALGDAGAQGKVATLHLRRTDLALGAFLLCFWREVRIQFRVGRGRDWEVV